MGRTIAIRQVPSGTGAGTLYYPVFDQLGTTIAMLDQSGTVVASQKYWPYGGTRAGGAIPTDKHYTGQQQESGEPALGLYNYKARFYSTMLGRFVSVDPVISDTYDPQAWNGYSYVGNNPLGRTDRPANASAARRTATAATTAPEIRRRTTAGRRRASVCVQLAARRTGHSFAGRFGAVPVQPGAPVLRGGANGMPSSRTCVVLIDRRRIGKAWNGTSRHGGGHGCHVRSCKPRRLHTRRCC